MKVLIATSLLARSLGASDSTSHLSHSKALKQRADGPRATDAADAVSSRSSGKKIKSHDSDIAGSKPKLGADTGILFREKSTPSRRLAATCTDGSVVCVDGYADNETCEVACDGMCCVSEDNDACDDFTGEVCKDGVSCSGDRACYGAKVDMIVNGCNGTIACFSAGSGGSIGGIYNSCQGDTAACFFAGYGGSIGEIYNSCLGYNTCSAAGYGGNISAIQNSCLGYKACAGAASYSGNIGNISSSCHGNFTCYYAAGFGGSIGNILDSCEGVNACNYAAYKGGLIAGIKNACNADSACYAAGRNSTISSEMYDCCNMGSACANITTLPAECEKPSTTAPTVAPSKPPTRPKSGKSKRRFKRAKTG
mmetsp:Transcript_25951/g.47724  ORF Transcript_25951/g.47724 Transcript_25951/m.47724 type:complete len:366 (+) Transcript_25951:255-1352(+)